MKYILNLFFVILLVGHANAQTPEDIERKFETYKERVATLQTLSMEDTYFSTITPDLSDLYNDYISQDIRSTILKSSNPELQEQAQSLTIEYLLDVKDHDALDFAENIFREKEKTGRNDDYDTRSLHSLMLLQNASKRAIDFAKNYMSQDYVKLSRIFDAVPQQPNTAILVTRNSFPQTIDTTSFDMSDYTGLISVVHPKCHFFHNFLHDIPQDQDLKQAIIDNTLWISSSWLAFDQSDFTEWNENIPDIQIHIAKDMTEWPDINYRGSPSFYFFKDGTLEHKIVGWPKGSMNEKSPLLHKGFRAINLPVKSTKDPEAQ